MPPRDPADCAQALSERSIDVDGFRIPYIDVRAYDEQAALVEKEKTCAIIGGDRDLKGVVIAGEQRSGELAISLASRGIFLLVAGPSEPLDTLLKRFQTHLRVMAAAARAPAPPTSLAPSGQAPFSTVPHSPARTESAFAQKPAQFNQAAYQDWMALLSRPWHESDTWGSDS
jgi:hypothetical protein